MAKTLCRSGITLIKKLVLGSTRDAVRLTIQDYLWSEQTGLPETYSEEEVRDKTEAVFVHVFRAYPTVPSPYYASMAS
jgi:type I restriction enzyme, R subunit